MTEQCRHNRIGYCYDCDTDKLAKVVSGILSEHGLPVFSPDEGTLDDVERERWNACVEIVKVLRG